MDYIAITDHFSNSWKSDIIPTLDNVSKIEEYLGELTRIQHYLVRSSEDLRIFKGVEIDSFSSSEYIKNLIDPSKFEIILFEYIEDIDILHKIWSITNEWKLSLSKTIIGLAHFDPRKFNNDEIEQLISFIKEYAVYFEFNSSYPQYYTNIKEGFFQKLRKNNVHVAIGCDSHNLVNLSSIKKPFEMIKHYKLEDNFRNFITSLNNLKNEYKNAN